MERRYISLITRKTKKNGSSISGIGEEAAISSTETADIWLLRVSNAFIRVTMGQKQILER